jgi:hypothetical protein
VNPEQVDYGLFDNIWIILKHSLRRVVNDKEITELERERERERQCMCVCVCVNGSERGCLREKWYVCVCV